MEMPKTRDQFSKNPLTKLLAPRNESKRAIKDERFIHDKLNIKDIKGAESSPYGKNKKFEGRNSLEVRDIDKTKPA
jgi:hypothetical protein